MTPEQLLKASDLCVKCGFCLPHCPTYRVSRDEGDSPRGRIALIQAVVSGQLRNSPKLKAHLDRCLGCRTCESACPSVVPYGRLIDGVREEQNRQDGFLRRQIRRGALSLLSSRIPLKIGASLLRWLPRHRLSVLVRPFGSGGVQRLVSLLPDAPSPVRWETSYSVAGVSQGQVGLFTGCISRISDQEALLAAIRVLNRLDLDVIVPPDQVCCGALHLHGGEPDTAQRLASLNREAFDGQGLKAILSIASGCAAHLKGCVGLSAPVLDISAYLNGLAWTDEVELAPLPKRVVVHEPCSLRNLLGTADAAYQVLGRIPDIELVSLPGNSICCGAGGANLLTEPQMADALLILKLAALRECGSDTLVTSNTGCGLHLAAGIRKAGLNIEVLHPVELIDRQMRQSRVSRDELQAFTQ